MAEASFRYYSLFFSCNNTTTLFCPFEASAGGRRGNFRELSMRKTELNRTGNPIQGPQELRDLPLLGGAATTCGHLSRPERLIVGSLSPGSEIRSWAVSSELSVPSGQVPGCCYGQCVCPQLHLFMVPTPSVTAFGDGLLEEVIKDSASHEGEALI